MSPTERTQAYLRRRGYKVANCEKKAPITPAGFKGPLVTQDLFKMIDTLALPPASLGLLRMVGIQTTVGASHASHRDKIRANPVAKVWLRYAQLEIWSWSKRGPRGKRKLWTLRREVFMLDKCNRLKTVESTNYL